MNQTDQYQYLGNELDVFAHAVNWKSYLRSQIGMYLHGDVLEVGAGIGGTTAVLCDGRQESWTCLEPDAELASRLMERAEGGAFALAPQLAVGTLEDLDPALRFDAILYIDVLEHIEDDRSEVAQAVERLKEGGALIVLCPAHQFLFTSFDEAVGHYRRYDKRMYRALTPADARLERLRYLDSMGMLLSLGNRLWLRSGSPTLKQIKLWDRLFVRLSRLVDGCLCRQVGKSILGIWRKPS